MTWHPERERLDGDDDFVADDPRVEAREVAEAAWQLGGNIGGFSREALGQLRSEAQVRLLGRVAERADISLRLDPVRALAEARRFRRNSSGPRKSWERPKSWETKATEW